MREAIVTVQLGEDQIKRVVAEALERFKASLVLTWHPVTADPSEPIEVPLNMHVAWNPEELGEFRVSTREISPSTEDGVR